MTVHLRQAMLGFLFGFVLSRIGFSDFASVHAMFLLTDLRLLLAFMLAVAILTPVIGVMARNRAVPGNPIHPGTVPGSVLFGAGWAICGACPSIALVQLGEGRLAALATIAGIVLGNAAYPAIHARFFRWDVGSCSQ